MISDLERKLLPPTEIVEQKCESPEPAGSSSVNRCQKPNAQKWIFALRGCFPSAVSSVCVCVRWSGKGEREEVWHSNKRVSPFPVL